ncbi:MAG: ribonuclease BN [Candidatus Omnitrophica bacterium CG11_big_fil_rev_8_21_14_0_20_64_10]|nr:MAG: ribonuclease BN [Candidatus Omnitrophica bacterium CG11_big_fil_rev_8_21_14_0_20_64_10]
MSRLLEFLREDIWRIRMRQLPRRRSWMFRPLRVVLLALRGFEEDRCQLRASALTFYTLLSIVPVLAMAFGVAKGFGLQNHMETILTQRLQGQEQVVQWLIQFANAFLNNAKGGVIAGVGVALLFWIVIKVLGNIEQSFNHIWGVQRGRTIGRRLTDYLSLMLICPVLLMTASSVTVFVATHVASLTGRLSFLGPLAVLIEGLLNLLPYAVLWGLFSFLYMFLPNTRVSLKAGITAGIAAGTIYQAVQWGYLHFQIGVSKFNAIYGSFAALPLFLVWLQVSWLVVLFGAEVSFAVDNEETYEFERDCREATPRFRRLLALRLAERVVKRFEGGEPPPTARELSHRLDAPIRLVRELLNDLAAVGIVTETQHNGAADPGFLPARDPAGLTLKEVWNALDRRGRDNPEMVRAADLEQMTERMDAMDAAVRKSPANILLKEL